MAVLINWKICDNAKECYGIAVCKTGTLTWDEKKKTIVIDNSKCVSCGLCEQACEVNAIKVAKTPEEYKKIKKQIDEDPRKEYDLFVDRYGAVPIHKAFQLTRDKFQLEVLEASRTIGVEFYNDNSIQCLLSSIPIGELFEGKNIKFRKLSVEENDNLLKKYKINKLPTLAFFRDGKLLDKIEGYYKAGKKEELIKKIESIIS